MPIPLAAAAASTAGRAATVGSAGAGGGAGTIGISTAGRLSQGVSMYGGMVHTPLTDAMSIVSAIQNRKARQLEERQLGLAEKQWDMQKKLMLQDYISKSRSNQWKQDVLNGLMKG